MEKYITRTVELYNTKVTFVMNNQINEHTLIGLVGKKEAKKKIEEIFDAKDVIIVSCKKIAESSRLYRMRVSDFIENAEVLETDTPNHDTSSEV